VLLTLEIQRLLLGDKIAANLRVDRPRELDTSGFVTTDGHKHTHTHIHTQHTLEKAIFFIS